MTSHSCIVQSNRLSYYAAILSMISVILFDQKSVTFWWVAYYNFSLFLVYLALVKVCLRCFN